MNVLERFGVYDLHEFCFAWHKLTVRPFSVTRPDPTRPDPWVPWTHNSDVDNRLQNYRRLQREKRSCEDCVTCTAALCSLGSGGRLAWDYGTLAAHYTTGPSTGNRTYCPKCKHATFPVSRIKPSPVRFSFLLGDFCISWVYAQPQPALRPALKYRHNAQLGVKP